MYANLQSKYAGNLAKIKTLKRRMGAWDMVSPFVIPDLIDPYALSVKDPFEQQGIDQYKSVEELGYAYSVTMPKLAT